MRRYHLSCGDSSRGPVGLCGTVHAPNKRQALVVFRRALQNGTGAFGEVPVQTVEPGVEYINVYITARNIRMKEIDSEGA